MKKLITTLAIVLATVVNAETPTITDVTAKQRYPWNGLVDITCKVSGINGTTNGLKFIVSAVMPDSGGVRELSHFWVVQNGTNSTDRNVHVNGDYRLLWDAQSDLGQVRYENMVVRVTVDHGKVQLWEGGPYWAETNIGADEPWKSGYYFWWGDTVGYRYENNAWVASDGSSSNFPFNSSNVPTYDKDIATLQNEGWITADGVLVPEHDAAHVQWGGNWRMPTEQELYDLKRKCDWTWTALNGVNGYVVRGRGDYSRSSIFLPCTGRGNEAYFYDTRSYGYYWSSVLISGSSGSTDSWCLYFDSRNRGTNFYYRYYGQPVRPVQEFAK